MRSGTMVETAASPSQSVTIEFSASSEGQASCLAQTRLSLQDILNNHLISSRIVPHLSLHEQLLLASTSKDLRTLLNQNVEAASSFKYVSLSNVRRAQLDTNANTRRSEDLDPALTEDDFYSRPLKTIFYRLERNQWLHAVSTLVLDGLCVPTEVVRHIVMDERFSVRILSIRDVQQLNIVKLCQTLRYISRPSRPAGTPRLRGLYVFGPKEVVQTRDSERWARRRSPTRFVDVKPQEAIRVIGKSLGEEWNRRSMETLAKDLENHDDKWYLSAGKVITRTPHDEWAQTLMVCQDIIHLDAVLCRGPRHNPDRNGMPSSSYLPPTVATVALGSDGCDGCKSCPEGPGVFDQSPAHQLPLLAPPPFTSSTLRAAQMPSSVLQDMNPRLIVRCTECLKGRWCERCHKWWCESCYVTDASTSQEHSHTASPEATSNESMAKEEQSIKVHMGLCTEYCLIQDMQELWVDMPGNGQF